MFKNIPENKKKLLWALLAFLVLVAAALIFSVSRKGSGSSEEWTSEDYTGGMAAVVSFYNGTIASQETWEIQKDANREIDQIFVEEGDTVTTGQQLFSYKTSDTALQIQQAEIELKGYDSEITDANAQISLLSKMRSSASAEEKLDLDSQIRQYQSSIQQAELNKKIKQAEIDEMKKTSDNAVVTSTMNGIVKTISTSSEEGSTSPFMTILSSGDLWVKGVVDEENVWNLYEGMPVLVHSRADETKVWNGTITRIDTDSTVSNSSGYSDTGSDMQASKYNFYVTLDTDEKLLLGQHVYIEPLMDDLAGEEVYEDAEGLSEEGADADTEEGAEEDSSEVAP